MKFNKNNVYIIAEAGVNHNGEFDKAIDLVSAAADAGADAVKFQTFNPEKLAHKNLNLVDYQKNQGIKSETQLEMLKSLELHKNWHVDLKNHANSLGLDFSSTAFDDESLDFLLELDIPFLKIPSGEITNLPFIWRHARTFKPLIISSGMSTLDDIEKAIATTFYARKLKDKPNNLESVIDFWNSNKNDSTFEDVYILHCLSEYPAPPDQINLNAINTIKETFKIKVGYSDHTADKLASLSAVALGASIIEKHFTLDKNLDGPDHASSLNPLELKEMVSEIREVSSMLGNGIKLPQKSEVNNIKKIRKQIVAAKNIHKGAIITQDDIKVLRCGEGLSAEYYWDLVGSKADKSYEKNEIFKNEE
jgi:N-acetylneuraminate synthase